MPKEKPELSDAMRKKMSGKRPEKNAIHQNTALDWKI